MPVFSVPTVFTVKEQLTAFFSKGEASANKFETSVNAAFKRTGKEASLFKQILGGVTFGNLAAKGIEGLGGFIKGIPEELSSMAEKGAALGKTAQIIGVNTDELQRFNYAAKMSDISVNGMQASLMKMNNGLAQLKVHQGSMESGLKRIDPQLMIQLRHTTDSKDAFLAVADAIQKTENPQKRAAIAMAVFGKAGQEMIPMLMQGREGIEKTMAATEKNAGMMGGDAVEAAKKYSEAMKNMSGTMQSLKSAAIAPLLTAITPYLDEAVEWVNTNRVMLKQDISGFVKGFAQGIKEVVPILRDVLWVVKNIGPPVLAGFAAFQLIKGGMLAAAAAGKIFGVVNTILFAYQAVAQGAATKQEALNMVMKANPLGLVCTIISVAVGLFVLLSNKMGGAANAAKFLGGVLMATLLAPVNFVIDAIKALFGLVSMIPGIGPKLKPELDDINKFQGGMNTALTGSAGETDYAGIYRANLSADKKAASADPYAAAQTKQAAMAAASGSVDPGDDRRERQAPNRGAVALQMRHENKVYVDNSKAPGIDTRVRFEAPSIDDSLLGANP